MFSLYQVIGVINSPEYQSLHGSNPLSPNKINDSRSNPSNLDKSVKRVKFFPFPDFNDNNNPKPKQRKHEIELQHANQPNEFFQKTRTKNDYKEMKKTILINRQFRTDYNNNNRHTYSTL